MPVINSFWPDRTDKLAKKKFHCCILQDIGRLEPLFKKGKNERQLYKKRKRGSCRQKKWKMRADEVGMKLHKY